MVLEYILLAVLLLAALFIIFAVIMQKSSGDGLSSTIAGGQETYYGKDKSAHTDRLLFKWTAIASIVLAVAVLLAYVIQPDYSSSYSLDYWQDISKYMSNSAHTH